MRVLIADRRQELRSALRFLLSEEPGITIVGESGDSQELLAELEVVRPHVVLLDCELPGLPTSELLAALHARDLNLRVFVLCCRMSVQQAALAAGAHAFIDKRAHPKRLVTALRDLQLESAVE